MHRQLEMELREVDEQRRQLVGCVAPYDETTYLTQDPRGERILRGCFSKSVEQAQLRKRHPGVPLLIGHNHAEGRVVGRSVEWADGHEGLLGVFQFHDGATGDAALAEVKDGYLPALSVGFEPITQRRGADGAAEISMAKLHEVSLVALSAYAGAEVLAVRSAAAPSDELARWHAEHPRPEIDLSPLPPIWG